ncbi:MAG: glycerate kinase [Bacteroidetes bacterium]|nr:MAG: glycerate kinase [Bacteroidota bacterium]RLD94980.1 MAG: glycerate kinase [Bacteroidota bacterium]
MNILIAPDSFKDCLSAVEVAAALARGIKKIIPDASFMLVPMADGGEGTVESVIDVTRGKRIELQVKDSLMRDVPSFYGITGDGETAVIEMAAASGIELLNSDERDPWITSTYGTGQLIRDALDCGVKKIMLGIGGSATNDCGAGMAEALGVTFSGKFGSMSVQGGGALGEVEGIHMEALDPRLVDTEIVVACDVSNPLTGPQGASAVYGPQKGADTEMVEKLDRNLTHFAKLIRNQLGKEVNMVAGAGAAGGLGAGLMAFLDASLVKGFDLVADVVGLEEKIRGADLVITGEGKMDKQTRFGKTPFGVAQMARKKGLPVIGVAGTLDEDASVLYELGFDLLMPIQEKPGDLEFSLRNAEQLLERTGERIARLLKMEI